MRRALLTILAVIFCVPAWALGPALNVTNVPAAGNLTLDCTLHDIVVFGNSATATMPSASDPACYSSGQSHEFVLKKGDITSGYIVLTPQSGQLIEYAPSFWLQLTNDGFRFFSDGTMWRSETQTHVDNPFSQRTVTCDNLDAYGNWHSVLMRDRREIIHVSGDPTSAHPSGCSPAIYLDNPGNAGTQGTDDYANNATLELQYVGTNGNPVSIWVNAPYSINNSSAPVYLQYFGQAVTLRSDGTTYRAIGGWYDGWLKRTWP